MAGFVCGVDIGGTFTDSVLMSPDGRVEFGKALSSPVDFFKSGFFNSINAAASRFGLERDEVFKRLDTVISHGSTVATNIVVQGNGAKVGLLTTLGFEDQIMMMRGLGRVTGEPAENLLRVAETHKPDPLVPRSRVIGITQRHDADGDEIVALDEDGVRAAARRLTEAGAETIAIAFLWSIRNPSHERRARELVREVAPEMFVSISSDISAAVGEYERIVAAVINAFVGPVTNRYLDQLQGELRSIGFAGNLHIMQCHGGVVPISVGAERPIFTIGSGPVGGLIGCARVTEELGSRNIIASDMGGTSFDVGIVKDGEPLVADDTVLEKYRYKVPAVEVISIGAGGGSIAWVDPHGGGLRVGPRSASSLPGPACYGRGGIEPTVTDADVVLGYIDPKVKFGTDGFSPDKTLAEQAIARVAEPLGLSIEEAALGIVEVANAKMANLLENEIIGRGFDPRDFLLMSYGGAGPIHAAGYASTLGIGTVVCPGEAASVWSAFGIANAAIRYQFENSVVFLQPFVPSAIEESFGELEREVRVELEKSDDPDKYEFRRFARIKFQWQLHELEMQLPTGKLDDARVADMSARFVALYTERYGEAALLPGARLEIVTLRLEPVLHHVDYAASRAPEPVGEFDKGTRTVYFERGKGGIETQIYNGDAMPVGCVVEGPTVIDLSYTGVVVPPGTSCERWPSGDLVLRLGRGGASA